MLAFAKNQDAGAVHDNSGNADQDHAATIDFDRIKQPLDGLVGNPRNGGKQQKPRGIAAEGIGFAPAVAHRPGGWPAKEHQRNQRRHQPDRVDNLMEGIGQHHNGAECKTNDDLDDGESDVDRGGGGESAGADLAVIVGVAVTRMGVLVRMRVGHGGRVSECAEGLRARPGEG